MKENQDKVNFITADDTFCYVVIQFNLKNVEMTYQRLMDKMFAKQLRCNVEVYIDDILVKSLLTEGLVLDPEETFATIKGYGMKLNPEKCLFGL